MECFHTSCQPTFAVILDKNLSATYLKVSFFVGTGLHFINEALLLTLPQKTPYLLTLFFSLTSSISINRTLLAQVIILSCQTLLCRPSAGDLQPHAKLRPGDIGRSSSFNANLLFQGHQIDCAFTDLESIRSKSPGLVLLTCTIPIWSSAIAT